MAGNWRDAGKDDERIVRLYKSCHSALSVDITALWLRESHPCKHKATPTRTHTNAHASRAPQAWHAGTAHYYNAKLLVAKETWGRGRVPVSMVASSHPANCLLPRRLDHRRQREKERRGRKSEGRMEWRERLEGVMLTMWESLQRCLWGCTHVGEPKRPLH